jgi:hypothetical protein
MRLAPLALLLATSFPAVAADPVAKPGAASPSKEATILCTIRAIPDDETPTPHAALRVVFDGPCRFLPDGKGGSFSLSALDAQAPLYTGILVVSVSVVAPGEAEVRGLTAEGINSRWGEARRSKADPACWTGSDFEVCARRKK